VKQWYLEFVEVDVAGLAGDDGIDDVFEFVVFEVEDFSDFFVCAEEAEEVFFADDGLVERVDSVPDPVQHGVFVSLFFAVPAVRSESRVVCCEGWGVLHLDLLQLFRSHARGVDSAG